MVLRETRSSTRRSELRCSLADKHAVAVTVEAVTGGDGVIVGAEDIFAAGQRGDESEQAGLGQVEICEELIHYADGLAGVEEDCGFGAAGARQGVRGFVRGVFEGADDGGAYGEDRATRLLRAGDRVGRGF